MRGTETAGRSTSNAVGCGERGRIALLTAMLAAGALAAGCSDPGTVTQESKLREAPAAASKVLAVIPAGSAVKVGDCGNGWCRASWNGHDGYILTKSMHLSDRAFRNTPEQDQAREEDEGDDEAPVVPDDAPPPSSTN